MTDDPTGHVVATRTNVAVCLGLLVLTLATTLVARVDLGPWNFVLAMLIAMTKVLLIVLYFMHLRYGPGLMRLVAAGGVLWLMILLLGTMDDFLTRPWFSVGSK